MASKIRRPNGVIEYQFEKKGLLKRTSRRFSADKEKEGDDYAANVDRMLERGVVPLELLDTKLRTVGAVLDLYEVTEVLSHSSVELIPTLYRTIGATRISEIDNAWLDDWITKLRSKYAPSTVKKRVELFGRCLNWGMRKSVIALTENPVDLLPKGYASDGKDHSRDRRLSKDGKEEEAIRKVLVGAEEHLIFDMALESAMRLREMYTLTREQIDIKQATIFLDKTKNGDKRQVPMSSVLLRLVTAYLDTLEGDRLFSWWDGRVDTTYLNSLSTKISQRFARRFEKAKCGSLHFHDLRHEATSRIYERTTLSDLEISKITGHKDPRMLSRYANLRGSDLSVKLW